LDNLSLWKSVFGVIVGLSMNRHCGGTDCNLQDRFRLGFQRRLRQALARHHSAAEGFGPAWEATLNEVPLDDADQAIVYWDLIRWAGSGELFTGSRESELLTAWRDIVHEL
jgi:hypothetical protein